MNEAATIREILQKTRTIAVVGLSDKPGRPSLGVSRYMQQQGYRIVPVNPTARSQEILGERVHATLYEACAACGPIDLVNVFRAPAFVPEIVKDAMRLKIPYLWLQMGVCHDEAARWAEGDGIKVVMDRCIMVDHAASGR
jgi:predicted CoA-binding protein